MTKTRGRPKKLPSEKAVHKVTISFTTDELERVEEDAKKLGLPISAYGKAAILIYTNKQK